MLSLTSIDSRDYTDRTYRHALARTDGDGGRDGQGDGRERQEGEVEMEMEMEIDADVEKEIEMGMVMEIDTSLDGYIDGWTDGRTDERMDGWMHVNWQHGRPSKAHDLNCLPDPGSFEFVHAYFPEKFVDLL